MVYIDGYTIEQYPTRNKIVITLPQKIGEEIDTITESRNRKSKLSENELATILAITKYCYEYEYSPDSDISYENLATTNSENATRSFSNLFSLGGNLFGKRRTN